MKWIKVKIYTTPQGLEPLGTMLQSNDISSYILNDPNNIDELHSDKAAPWDYIDEEIELTSLKDCNIEFYLNQDEAGEKSLTKIKNDMEYIGIYYPSIDLGSLDVEISSTDNEDWANNWKKYFKPLKVGETFYIKPSWENITEKHNRKILEIDPSNSFGTGTHATTQLCLCALEKQELKDARVLDLGCGSGILGIGACLHDAKIVTFVDIDTNCIETSKINTNDNNISKDKIEFHLGNVLDDDNLVSILKNDRYDIVVANIMADIIIYMAHILPLFLKNDGILLASGIILERLDDVNNALKANKFNILSIDTQDGWAVVYAKQNMD